MSNVIDFAQRLKEKAERIEHDRIVAEVIAMYGTIGATDEQLAFRRKVGHRKLEEIRRELLREGRIQ
jgi:hypothetical protein